MYFLPDKPEGHRGSEGCVVLALDYHRLLAFSWNAPPNFPKIRNGSHKTRVDIHFEKLSSEKTKVTLCHSDWLEGGRWPQLHDYFTRAWSKVMNNLEASFT